jgi:hypothetical protein
MGVVDRVALGDQGGNLFRSEPVDWAKPKSSTAIPHLHRLDFLPIINP